MEHKVLMTVELTVEAKENKTQENVEDFAYFRLETYLEEMATSEYVLNGCQVKAFNIEII